MGKLDLDSDESADISIANDSNASIYLPIEDRLDNIMGRNKEYKAAKRVRLEAQIARRVDQNKLNEIIEDINEAGDK